MSNVVYLY